MVRITAPQVADFRRIWGEFGERLLRPSKSARCRFSDNDVWLKIVEQVVVVGKAGPADELRKPAVRREIAWNRVSRMRPSEAKRAVSAVLRRIGTRWASADWRSCRKTAALARNLAFLKAYPKGPRGFLNDVAALDGPSDDKVAFVSDRLSYIKNKGARDLLSTGFGLVNDHIAFDVRVVGILRQLGVPVTRAVLGDPVKYRELEQDLLRQVCRPLGITGAELDHLLFNHYSEIKRMLR